MYVQPMRWQRPWLDHGCGSALLLTQWHCRWQSSHWPSLLDCAASSQSRRIATSVIVCRLRSSFSTDSRQRTCHDAYRHGLSITHDSSPPRNLLRCYRLSGVHSFIASVVNWIRDSSLGLSVTGNKESVFFRSRLVKLTQYKSRVESHPKVTASSPWRQTMNRTVVCCLVVVVINVIDSNALSTSAVKKPRSSLFTR